LSGRDLNIITPAEGREEGGGEQKGVDEQFQPYAALKSEGAKIDLHG